MGKHKLANDNAPRGLVVEIAESIEEDGAWVVEAVDEGSEGEVYFTLFSGPQAEQRAWSYARWVYGVGV